MGLSKLLKVMSQASNALLNKGVTVALPGRLCRAKAKHLARDFRFFKPMVLFVWMRKEVLFHKAPL